MAGVHGLTARLTLP